MLNSYKKFLIPFLCVGMIINMAVPSFAGAFSESLPAMDLTLSDIDFKDTVYNNVYASEAADIIVKESADIKDYKKFNILASKYVGPLYNTYNVTNSEELKDKIYFTAIPAIWHNALLEDVTYYSKIFNLYQGEADLCFKASNKCNYKKGGFALQILFNSHNKNTVSCQKIDGVLSNKDISEEDKIAYLQYAAPVMAVKSCKVSFENAISNIGKNNTYGAKYCEFDPFALVHVIDKSYGWVKETCSHAEGFWRGICARYGADEKPFLQYKYVPTPAIINKLSSPTKALLACIGGKNQEPYLYASALRMYSEFFINEYNWQDSVSFLINDITSTDVVVSAARELALVSALDKMPSGLGDRYELRNYFSARLHNAYFFLDSDKEVDQTVKAGLKNELGSAYAKLSGYTGSSPIKLKSPDGFLYEIKFTGNEQDIEGFWKSFFNFSDRPAEALTNINIIALVSKGGIKQVSKLGSIGALFNKAAGFTRNIPAIMARARVQYRAIQYLAAKSNMSAVTYGYRNMIYRNAADKAASSGMTMVEGKAVNEFFSSSHYNPAAHGNISAVAKDIKQASAVGVTALGKGGSVPSFIPQERFGDVAAYTDDFVSGREGLKNLVSKYKGSTAVVSNASKMGSADMDISKAEFLLPRKYLYSFDTSKYLPFVQSYSYSADYLLRDRMYKMIQDGGIKFFNIANGNILPYNLNFHQDGVLVSKHLIGRIKMAGPVVPGQTGVAASGSKAGGLLGNIDNNLQLAAGNLASDIKAGINTFAFFKMPDAAVGQSLSYAGVQGGYGVATQLKLPQSYSGEAASVSGSVKTLQNNTKAMGLNRKKFGFSLLRSFGMHPKKALNFMYSLGAVPERSIRPALTGERYLIENIDDYAVSKEAASKVPFPHFYSRHSVYRGMSLNAQGLDKILTQGLLVKDTSPASNTMGTIYMRTSQRAIFFDANPKEAGFYSRLHLSEKRGIAVVVSCRGMNFFGSDLLLNGISTMVDVPAGELKTVSALLNINEVPVWGKIIKEDGRLYFLPYK